MLADPLPLVGGLIPRGLAEGPQAIGVLWPLLGRLGLGRLPGDIFIRGQHGAFYFPITTCILVSVVLSLLWWLQIGRAHV